MSDPLAPNYVNGVGRLVTDRFDFQKHVDGESFRHDANQIDLSPPVFVDGYSQNTVQEALQTLSNYILPPTIPDATTTEKGIIQLSGDISGTAASVEVVKIRGFDVTTLAPSANDVLTWDGVNNYWAPAAATNTFTPGNDLAGNNLTQDIVGITGDVFNSSLVTVSANNFKFTETSTPIFDQSINTTNPGTDFIINAQGSTSSRGGFVKISGGIPGSGQLRGGVSLSLGNSSPEPLLQITEVAANRRVIGLAKDSDLDIGDMPLGTGDRVIYIRNAATPPTSGNPVNGAILYGSGGKLRIKQEDGNDFIIGSVPNPSIWGPANAQVYTRRDFVSSFAGNYATAYTYATTPDTTVKFDIIFVGRGLPGLNVGYTQNLTSSYIIDNVGNTLGVFGGPYWSNTSYLPGPALDWTQSSIGVAGSSISIRTPYSNTYDIRWLVITQITIAAG